MNRLLQHAILLAGLAAIAWVGAGYAGAGHPLALAVTGLIAAFYLFGALELARFHQATRQLARTLADTHSAPAELAGWLQGVPQALRNAVRLRVEGQRVALPGPALTPYLAGLLVLLGMLGTFLGLVVTLRGTGLALQGATDLASVRNALAAPVTGLGVAFGTSLAGVAASATLGLVAALLRRERAEAGQALDALAAGPLRGFSAAHQREASFGLLQRQAEAMPQLVDRLQQMLDGMARQQQATQDALLASQQRFHSQTETVYTQLAGAVDQALQNSLAESARLAGAAIQPAVEAAMAGIAREAAAVHGQVADKVQHQLDTLATRFAASADGVARHWREALAEQRDSQAALGSTLQGTLEQFSQHFAQRSETLVEQVSTHLAYTAGSLAERWHDTLRQHAQQQQAQAGHTQQALTATASQLEQHAAALLQGVEQSHARLQAQVEARDAERLAAWEQALQRHEQATQTLTSGTQQALAGTAQAFTEHAAALQSTVAEAHARLQAEAQARDAERLAAWIETLTRHEQATQALTSGTQQALAGTAQAFTEHTAALHREVEQAHARLQAEVQARDAQRLASWSEALARHEQAAQALTSSTRQALADASAAFADQVAALQAQVGEAHAALESRAAAHGEAQRAAWNDALARHAQVTGTLSEQTRAALADATSGLVQQAEALQRGVAEAHAQLQAEAGARDAAREAAWTERLERLAGSLAGQWQQASAHALEQQQRICATLADTAQAMTRQAEAQASATVAEIGRLVEAAAEAPRAAAEVIDALRDKLTEAMARDNAMLAERAQVLDTLRSLLDAVTHASSEQRAAIDALVEGSAQLLERAGDRLQEQAAQQGAQLAEAVTQLGVGAAEVASLGEAFGAAVQQFGQSNDQLGAHLQQLDATLARSIARSDEQLAYYVAQAREVIDLSLMSHKQIMDDLQQLAQARATEDSPA